MPSVFLSHNSADKPFVRKLARDLSKFDVHCWIDEAEIKVGDSLIQKIGEGITDCEFLGVVLSPNSTSSEWVKRELEIALNTEIAGRKIKALPILLADCEIPPFLQGKVYADFRRAYNSGLSSLINRLAPKDRFDAELVALSRADQPTALASFKDEDDRPALRRRFPFTTTVEEIRAANPVKSMGLWVELHLDGVSGLNHVELFSFGRKRDLSLKFDMNIDSIVPGENDEKLWRKVIDTITDEVWSHDAGFLAAFDGDSLGVNWEGPNSRRVSANIEVNYYIENEWGYLHVERHFKDRRELDDETIEDLYIAANSLANTMAGVCAKVRSRIKRKIGKQPR